MVTLPTYSGCRLCGSGTRDSLCESHVFPKFYWEWMKETGDRYFRDPRRPNLRFQDGTKLKMLCRDCEARFSVAETPFAARIFRPLIADPAVTVAYDARS